MVSERYRDLLLSTTQISTVHESSILLSGKLKTVGRLCETPVEKTEDEATASPATGAGVYTMQSDQLTVDPCDRRCRKAASARGQHQAAHRCARG